MKIKEVTGNNFLLYMLNDYSNEKKEYATEQDLKNFLMLVLSAAKKHRDLHNGDGEYKETYSLFANNRTPIELIEADLDNIDQSLDNLKLP